jgi:hypothetical protein
MRHSAFITFLLVSTLFLGCSRKNPKIKDDTEHYSPTPIVEIRERLDYSLPDAFDKISLVLSEYNMYIPDGLSDNGRFSTTSIKIRDRMCDAQFLNDAPVSCDVRLHGRLTSLHRTTTELILTYRQHCLDQRHINNVCKNSNAEKLLFAIHGDIKSK